MESFQRTGFFKIGGGYELMRRLLLGVRDAEHIAYIEEQLRAHSCEVSVLA